MPPTILWVLIGAFIGVALALAGATYYYRTNLQPQNEAITKQAEADAEQRRQTAATEAQNLIAEAKQEAKQTRQEEEKKLDRRYQDLARTEERLDRRQANLDKQNKKLEAREQTLNKRQSRLDKRHNEIEAKADQHQAELERIAALTHDEAKNQLLELVETESRQDMARVMREIQERGREEAEEKARKFIAMAIQRVASEHVSETTISVVSLPSDDMKGRIIGRNGRNIRAFESAAGVDVIVDDTPEAVTVSCFDPVRREVAKRALTKLVSDGRIHPARIEKLINDANDEVEKDIKKSGEDAAYEANVHGLHPQILQMLGRLRYRTSYGQNQLDHAVEASKIASVLAAEMGANVNIAKMGALLHDLGKAMDHDQEGTHAQLGADFAKRFNVPAIVVNAIASHHHEVDQESVEAVIVEAADAISGARPGARRESMENYIKRIRTLEEIAGSFDGVETAYALQAGREIRILVKPGIVDDLGAMRLSRDISKTIEDSMQYPGQIQVTVIRETRAVGFAK